MLIFPEGTRSITGALQPFKIGVAVLAIQRNVPIIPVHIDRAYELFRKGQRFPRPGTITVTFGPSIQPPPQNSDMEHYQVCSALTKRLEAAVAQLADGARGNV